MTSLTVAIDEKKMNTVNNFNQQSRKSSWQDGRQEKQIPNYGFAGGPKVQ
jgi:hypothetical protein